MESMRVKLEKGVVGEDVVVGGLEDASRAGEEDSGVGTEGSGVPPGEADTEVRGPEEEVDSEEEPPGASSGEAGAVKERARPKIPPRPPNCRSGVTQILHFSSNNQGFEKFCSHPSIV